LSDINDMNMVEVQQWEQAIQDVDAIYNSYGVLLQDRYMNIKSVPYDKQGKVNKSEYNKQTEKAKKITEQLLFIRQKPKAKLTLKQKLNRLESAFSETHNHIFK
jgi:hypothetical protein